MSTLDDGAGIYFGSLHWLFLPFQVFCKQDLSD